jgi:hypothetical protein
VFPPLAAEPLVYFDGVDEVVEACYALAGPHRLTDSFRQRPADNPD